MYTLKNRQLQLVSNKTCLAMEVCTIWFNFDIQLLYELPNIVSFFRDEKIYFAIVIAIPRISIFFKNYVLVQLDDLNNGACFLLVT